MFEWLEFSEYIRQSIFYGIKRAKINAFDNFDMLPKLILHVYFYFSGKVLYFIPKKNYILIILWKSLRDYVYWQLLYCGIFVISCWRRGKLPRKIWYRTNKKFQRSYSYYEYFITIIGFISKLFV